MRTSITALLGKTAIVALAMAATPSFAEDDIETPILDSAIDNSVVSKSLTQAIDVEASELEDSAAQSASTSADDGAAAPTKSSDFTISGNAALTTDYRFRGIGFSDGDIAVQGGIDLGHSSGLYVGVWGSSIEDSATFGNSEIDIYGGWSGSIGGGITADVGLLYFYFPNGDNGAAGASDFFEPYASLSGTLGPAQLTVGLNYAWSQSAIADDDNLYLYTNLSIGIPNTPLTVNANYGYNTGSVSIAPDGNQSDFLLGVDYAVTSKLTASLAYVTSDTDLASTDGFNDDALVFTLGVSF